MKEYKYSFYNFSYEKDNSLYIYNSLNGLKAKIFEAPLIKQVKELQEGNIIKKDKLDKRIIDAGIAVESYIDELSVANEVIAKNIINNNNKLRFIILPTRECNFRCKYCYEDKQDMFMTEKTKENFINAVILYLKENLSVKELQLEWFGGEPLLCYDLIIDVSKRLKDYCDENNIFFFMNMTTNGYLLTKECAEKLLELNLFAYQITVDGQKNYHDNLRILKNGGGTWDKIYNNLLSLKEIKNDKLAVTIRINYHLDMLDDLPLFLRKIKKDFDNRFDVLIVKINPPDGFEFDCVTPELEYITYEYILSLMLSEGLDIRRYLPNINPTAAVCYARMNYSFIIDYDGTIRKCTEYLEDNIHNNIGNINNGYLDIDFKKHSQWIYPNVSMMINKGCFLCKDFPNCCGGLCPAQWYRNESLNCNPFKDFNETLLVSYVENWGMVK